MNSYDKILSTNNLYYEQISSKLLANTDYMNQMNLYTQFNDHCVSQIQQFLDSIQTYAMQNPNPVNPTFLVEMLKKNIFSRKLRCHELFSQETEPLLGLNYIIEFQFENVDDSCQYICELCQIKCSCTQTIISHLKNTHHRRKYLKIHHPEMYEQVLSTSTVRTEQQQMVDLFAKQVHIMGLITGQVQLHFQFSSSNGQKPLVIGILFDQPITSSTLPTLRSFQLVTKSFEDYKYDYDDVSIQKKPLNSSNEKPKIPQNDRIPRGLTEQDLSYPFDRQFWHDNYKDLLKSRPPDPHAVTYQEAVPEVNNFRSFATPGDGNLSLNVTSPTSQNEHKKAMTVENVKSIESNINQPVSRRVIFDSNRTSITIENGLSKQSNVKIDHGQGITCKNTSSDNGASSTMLNERSARAILAANGLFRVDDDINSSTSTNNMKQSSYNFDQKISPQTAKRMLEAVLSGVLDVLHIQPHFSTFVDLIRSGQIELERHQAEQLLQKVLVDSSPSSSSASLSSMIKSEPVNKRKRLSSYSSECSTPSAGSSVHQNDELYITTEQSNIDEPIISKRHVHVVGGRTTQRNYRYFD